MAPARRVCFEHQRRSPIPSRARRNIVARSQIDVGEADARDGNRDGIQTVVNTGYLCKCARHDLFRFIGVDKYPLISGAPLRPVVIS